ncbi:pentapeptide repeat-containing protein [Streptomyces puniciscabiei]|uniref:pentapeptide repeat-containing protein n=1 Tax=Streptomyces puniciscabiei TaxID=164348 RepID=UPI003317B9E8
MTDPPEGAARGATDPPRAAVPGTPDAPPQPPAPGATGDGDDPPPSVPDAPRGESTQDWTRRIEVLGTAIGGTLTAIAAIAAVLISVLVNHSETATTREGQITDRYTAAIDNLGNSSADVRLGGIYALQRIMKDSPRDQASIVDVLSAYVRDHSLPAGKESAGYSGRPEADVQAAFEVLARRDPGHDGSSEVDLREAHLPYIAVRSPERSGTIEEDLTGVDPAHLPDSNLSGADLTHANLPGSDLNGSYLVGVVLDGAILREADLRKVWLDNADLGHTALDRARLGEASLVDASLGGASLAGADLRDADLRGADLSGADLSGADLRGADLRTATHGTADGRAAGWTSLKTTKVTVIQLLAAELDSRTLLPPSIARDPRIKARIAASGPSPSGDGRG